MSERTGIMRPIPFNEMKFNQMPKPVWVQPKLEGDRMRYKDGQLLTSSGKERGSVPHIATALNSMELYLETDGELYVHGMKHSEIRSIVSRTKNLHIDHWKMEYHIYDVVTDDAQDERLERMRSLMLGPNIKIVPSYPCYSLEELQIYYDMFLDGGYEGIIVRHPDRPYKRSQVQWMMKLKPRLSGEFKIIHVNPLVDKYGETHHDQMGSFVLVDEEGSQFNVGTGPEASDRKLFMAWRERLVGMKCKIRFQGYTRARNVPKMQSIDKEWLSQIREELR